jgi:hypothetical protein
MGLGIAPRYGRRREQPLEQHIGVAIDRRLRRALGDRRRHLPGVPGMPLAAVSVWIPKCPQLPSIREALQLVLAPVLEPEIRSGYQVNDRA